MQLSFSYISDAGVEYLVSSIEFAFPGDNSGGATPVSIPNTAVKSSSADGTSRATSWESKTLPGAFWAC
jgi:hypothetical protein